MKISLAIILVILSVQTTFSQRLLTSWSQQNIENYTKEMYDSAQSMTTAELLTKNKNDIYWSEVFLTLNASINNYSEDIDYMTELSKQIPDTKETKLKGTSRLIIWDRIISGDIVFEGKGLIFENDLYTVGGRANQILQNLTNKNFGYVTSDSKSHELESLKNKWLDYLSHKPVDEYKPADNANAKIPEIANLKAVHAMIVSLQDNINKDRITKDCLRKIYNLDSMPEDKSSSAQNCNPDNYTFSYLAILFGEKVDATKDANWWLNHWNSNKNNFIWNSEKGHYEIKMK